MACFNCHRNEAVKTYERIKNGMVITEDYCLDCFHRLFLCVKDAEGETALSACPYCGIKLEEILSKKLVGCAYCYRTLENGLLPMVIQMQGVELHNGKRLGGELPDELLEMQAKFNTEDISPRFVRQCNELTKIIDKLMSEKRFEEAKDYADKLSRMKSSMDIEEEFVWRGNTKTTNRS
ncbi:MAG: hypothetical protein IJX87_04660 [Clostridia bacterium]|nr:hypothetical protein [Clostridia bacterium]